MKLFKYLKYCLRNGHRWRYDGDTLGGDWIRCDNCNALEEYLPGVHEPKGYSSPQSPNHSEGNDE